LAVQETAFDEIASEIFMRAIANLLLE
jgi:hypothetical protein